MKRTIILTVECEKPGPLNYWFVSTGMLQTAPMTLSHEDAEYHRPLHWEVRSTVQSCIRKAIVDRNRKALGL